MFGHVKIQVTFNLPLAYIMSFLQWPHLENALLSFLSFNISN